jgi:hypothetical protein
MRKNIRDFGLDKGWSFVPRNTKSEDTWAWEKYVCNSVKCHIRNMVLQFLHLPSSGQLDSFFKDLKETRKTIFWNNDIHVQSLFYI